ncbi:MAG: hypothetical protein M1827_002522 [Pycnora praestabilis]|nr:MAG: hypothetical protein M1827_002522 [Pycnora praestabilis]
MAHGEILLVVPRTLVETVKSGLEEHGRLDKKVKIRHLSAWEREVLGLGGAQIGGEDGWGEGERFLVPTTALLRREAEGEGEGAGAGLVEDADGKGRRDGTDPALKQAGRNLLSEIGLQTYIPDISIHIPQQQPRPSPPPRRHTSQNPLGAAISAWLSRLPQDLLQSIHITLKELLQFTPKSYTIYPPMLLLPTHTFQVPAWRTLFLEVGQDLVQDLYRTIALAMGVTHIAANAPIPLLMSQSTREYHDHEYEGSGEGDGSDDIDHPLITSSEGGQNILRRPSDLTPLYGNFGPNVATPSKPTTRDLEEAFWVSARQNDIYQTWAPLYTMFSRGNMSEKSRLLTLSTLRPPPLLNGNLQGVRQGEGYSVVDLYAGIGYFAFSYARVLDEVEEGKERAEEGKGGKKCEGRVLCWELSPWSVAGLRKGAGGNGWGVRVFDFDGPDRDDGGGGEDGQNEKVDLGDERIIVFREDNKHAVHRISNFRSAISPIRHVNCGLLPSSRGCWSVAVGALDQEVGGWLHIHENIAIKDIAAKSEEILDEIRKIVDGQDHCGGDDSLNLTRREGLRLRPQRKVECQHIERVKSYAPGVMHCVLDIFISHSPNALNT